jgi:hypothetical protein
MNLDNSERELDGLEIGLAVQEDLGGQLEQLSFRSLAGPRPARKHQNQHRSLSLPCKSVPSPLITHQLPVSRWIPY